MDLSSPDRVAHEVWVVDQSNSPGVAYGGAIYIYEDSALALGVMAAPTPTVIDVGQATAALCMSSTGAYPVRPHMLSFNAARTHAILSFVASGHVVVFDAETRAPVACLRTSPGAGGVRQAHAAMPSADGSFILVANQNGKLLERIDASYTTNTFAFNAAATINLATCATPDGTPCEFPGLRPDNAPICPVIDSSSSIGFVTLRGGGLFVVEPKATPMKIVAHYDRTTVHGNGCGGIQAGDRMFINSGGGTATNLSEFDVYRFPLAGFAATNPANTPAPTVLMTDDTGDRDAHGMAASHNGHYLWVVDRVRNSIEIVSLESNAREKTVNLAGTLSADPAPDLLAASPTGDVIYATLRGPTPLSGDPHSSTGTTPGFGIIRVLGSGRNGSLERVVRISNLDNGVERADPHGIAVRRK